jgi:hypothetical protein
MPWNPSLPSWAIAPDTDTDYAVADATMSDVDCCGKIKLFIIEDLKVQWEGWSPDEVMSWSCDKLKNMVGEEDYSRFEENLCGGNFDEEFQDIHTGEPMDIAYQLLKEENIDWHAISQTIGWRSPEGFKWNQVKDIERRFEEWYSKQLPGEREIDYRMRMKYPERYGEYRIEKRREFYNTIM